MSTPEVGRRTSTTTIDSPMTVSIATIGDLTMRMARVSQARLRSTDCGGQRRSTCGGRDHLCESGRPTVPGHGGAG